MRLVDGDGLEVPPVTEYLSSLLANGANPASLRSYAMDLLRWWRFLAAVEVAWDRVTRTDIRDFVLWMRSTTTSRARRRKAATTGVSVAIGRGYAPATINHNLAVLRGFYADRMAAGTGPVVNPVPEATGRRGQRPQAHQNLMRPVEPHRRAPLRQKIPSRAPRGQLTGGVGRLMLVGAIRPSYNWLYRFRSGAFFERLRNRRDPAGFARLDPLCEATDRFTASDRNLAYIQLSRILVHNGGLLGDITVADCIEAYRAQVGYSSRQHSHWYRLLLQAGILPSGAPPTIWAACRRGQLGVDELVDGYEVACTPVRHLLVD